MSDIVDRIDELVEEQLQQEASGYDHNINQEKCPHCGRDWHGLPITQRIARMYSVRFFDPTYSLADDDSPVVCPGSDFIGPMPPPRRAPDIEAVTIGAHTRTGWRDLSLMERLQAPHHETPNQIQLWNGYFEAVGSAVPVSDWLWSDDHTRARFTFDGDLPVEFPQLLSMMLTTQEPRRTWRIDTITTFVDGRRVAEVRDVQVEQAEIAAYLSPFDETGNLRDLEEQGWVRMGAIVEEDL